MLLELAIVIQTAGQVNDAAALATAQEILKTFTVIPKEQNFRVVHDQDRVVVESKVNVPNWYWGF